MKVRLGLKALPKREQDAVIQAAKNVYMQEQKKQLCRMWAVVLWTLHEEKGYGVKRLGDLIETIYRRWINADHKYEFDDHMTYGDFCEDRLRWLGVDVEEIYKKFEGDE